MNNVYFKKCELCGGELEIDETKILTSNPPKKTLTCKNCGHQQYEIIATTYTNSNIETCKTMPYQTGWVCPKCGSVMSPSQSFCVNCTPPKELKIWC